MKTFLFDLDDTILNLDWDNNGKIYYNKLAEYHADIIEPEKVAKYVFCGYRYMVNEVDGRTNKEKFYDKFEELSGIDKKILMAKEDYFYLNHFDIIKERTSPMENMVKAIKLLKAKGYPLILATNPVFPAIATRKRLAWTGLSETMFDKITTYEESSACKPQPAYYEELIEEMKLIPQDCVMVGNDRKEDMMAVEFGMTGILITDLLIDSDDKYNCREMTSAEFLTYVENI